MKQMAKRMLAFGLAATTAAPMQVSAYAIPAQEPVYLSETEAPAEDTPTEETSTTEDTPAEGQNPTGEIPAEDTPAAATAAAGGRALVSIPENAQSSCECENYEDIRMNP